MVLVIFPSEEEHAAAVIGALAVAGANPYDLDDVARAISDGTLPAYYTEVTVSPRYLGRPDRAGVSSDFRGVRVTTRAVAQTVSNAREMRRRADGALNEKTLTVAGFVSSPVEFETGESIGEDDGWYSGLTAWTYAV